MLLPGGERHQRSFKKYRAPQIIDAKITVDAQRAVKPMREWQLDNAAYLHYCPNETIDGIAIVMKRRILARKWSSRRTFLLPSRLRVDVSLWRTYAGAQKNIGPAGPTLVIVRE